MLFNKKCWKKGKKGKNIQQDGLIEHFLDAQKKRKLFFSFFFFFSDNTIKYSD